MQDADDAHAIPLLSIEHDVPTLFETPKPWSDAIAVTAEGRPIGERLARVLDSVEVAYALLDAPCPERVGSDLLEIPLGAGT